MIIFYLISFHSSAPPYTPQAAWSSPWKENLVWKGRRPCPWDARFSRVSWEGTQCLGTLLEHAQATVVTSKTLWKMGCSSNVCYGLDTEIAMPDPPGLCYARNQTGLRWSFLALKFSYSKILSHFLFSLNGRSISSQSPATFFSVQEIQFFFLFLEKIQRSFLCSEICFFLLLALWAVRKESVCLKSCSHWLQHKLFWVPCDNGSQLFLGSCVHLQTRNLLSVSVVASPFLNLVVWLEQPEQWYWWDHTDDLWDRNWHHRLFLTPELSSSSANAWEPIL